MAPELDEIDLRIVAALRKDARAPAADVGRDLDVPRSTVSERIKRLEDRGIIQGYTVKVDHERIGEGATAFILLRFRPDPGQRDQNISLSRQLGRLPGVEEVHMIAGEWDAIAKVRSSDLKTLFDQQMESIRRLPGIERTVTMTCFTTVKEPV
jgi:DNA-binding Lrp family transcriptional regulator